MAGECCNSLTLHVLISGNQMKKISNYIQGFKAFEKVIIGVGKDMKPIFDHLERTSVSQDGLVSVRLTRCVN